MTVETQPWDDGMEWSSLCDSVFNESLDDGDLFMSDDRHSKDSSLADICNFSNCGAGSDPFGQPHDTLSNNSQSTGRNVLQQRQSAYRGSISRSPMIPDAYKQSLIESVHEQPSSLTARPHPDLLSLGDFPSPPVISALPMSPPTSIQREHSRTVSRTEAPRKILYSKSKSCSLTRSVCASDSITDTPAGTLLPGWNYGSRIIPVSANEYTNRNDGWRDCSCTSSCVSEPCLSSLRTSSSFSALATSRLVRVPSTDDLLNLEDFAPGGSLAFRPDNLAWTDVQELSPLAKSLQQTHLHSSIDEPGIGQVAGLEQTVFSAAQLPSSQPDGLRTVSDAVPFVHPLPMMSSASQESQNFEYTFGQDHQDKDPRTSSQPELHRLAALRDGIEVPYRSSWSGIDDTILETTEDADGVPLLTDDNGPDIKGRFGSLDPSPAKLSSSWLGYNTNPELTVPPARDLYAMAPQTQPRPLQQRPQRNTDHSVAQRDHWGAVSQFLPSPSPSIAASTRRARSSRGKAGRDQCCTKQSGSRSQHGHPKRITGGHAFVNYTPQDHRKLLSGVAASGSLKTKARRDREMEVKRRRINQAAVMAVVEAGGDLERLREEGLLS
nr:developmental regulatory protein weta [Quercus suber]